MTPDETRSGRLCPKGLHKMDDRWDECPYCTSEERAKQRTTAAWGNNPAGNERKTSVGVEPPAARTGDRVTTVMPQGYASETGQRAPQRDTRKILGILVTYSWCPEGQVFPIREGKNFIGRGQISSEVVPRDCDVQIPEDERMSAEHFVILCRGGNYEIIDQMSSNGTFLENKSLRANQSEELKNYAEIRSGTTEWTFIRTLSQKAEQTAVAPDLQGAGKQRGEETFLK